MIKKIIYSLLTLLILLVVAIVVAANSSYVIKKVADIFAPDYKISYDDITGNVFTGVKIAGLKFDNKEITKNIKFSWNPSKILYKRVAINEISAEDLDVETVKALIASFPKSVEDDNTSASPLPVVINVDKIHLSVKPFEEQGVLIEKTVLDIADVSYAADSISVEKLSLNVDTNVTDLVLGASLDDGKLIIEALSVKNIDSETLEKMFLSKVPESEESLKDSKKQEKSKEKSQENSEQMNPLVPTNIEVKHFVGTLKPRPYKTVNVDKLEVTLAGVDADIGKILKNKENALMIGNYSLDLQSDIAQVDLVGDLRNSIVTVNDINIKKNRQLTASDIFSKQGQCKI